MPQNEFDRNDLLGYLVGYLMHQPCTCSVILGDKPDDPTSPFDVCPSCAARIHAERTDKRIEKAFPVVSLLEEKAVR